MHLNNIRTYEKIVYWDIHDYVLFLSWRHEPWKRHIPTACPMGPLPRGGAAPAGPPGAPPGGPRYGHGARGAAPGPRLTAKPHALDTHSRPGAHLTLVRRGPISFRRLFRVINGLTVLGCVRVGFPRFSVPVYRLCANRRLWSMGDQAGSVD